MTCPRRRRHCRRRSPLSKQPLLPLRRRHLPYLPSKALSNAASRPTLRSPMVKILLPFRIVVRCVIVEKLRFLFIPDGLLLVGLFLVFWSRCSYFVSVYPFFFVVACERMVVNWLESKCFGWKLDCSDEVWWLRKWSMQCFASFPMIDYCFIHLYVFCSTKFQLKNTVCFKLPNIWNALSHLCFQLPDTVVSAYVWTLRFLTC